MKNDTIKEIIKLKLKIADNVIDLFPDPIGGRVKELKKTMLEAITEADQEYQNDNKEQKEKGKIKPINID